jgi:hypothetical protein
LLSKQEDKKLNLTKKGYKGDNCESDKAKTIVTNNKYFSAPVSTKENGLVTKFKFNNTGN